MDKNKSVADFMNSFLNTPEPKIDNEYYEIEEQYFRQFGHGVPREMLPDSISTEQIKQAMKKCILSKKDNLFELLVPTAVICKPRLCHLRRYAEGGPLRCCAAEDEF